MKKLKQNLLILILAMGMISFVHFSANACNAEVCCNESCNVTASCNGTISCHADASAGVVTCDGGRSSCGNGESD